MTKVRLLFDVLFNVLGDSSIAVRKKLPVVEIVLETLRNVYNFIETTCKCAIASTFLE